MKTMIIERRDCTVELRNFELKENRLVAEYKVLGKESKNNDGFYTGAKLDGEIMYFTTIIKLNGKNLGGIKIEEPHLSELKNIENNLKEEAKKAKEQKLEGILIGKITIKLSYEEGEYLSGWTTYDKIIANLLTELGLAKKVGGWGTLVDSELIEALGEEFTYIQAKEYAENIKEENTEEQEKFNEAKKTGRPVELYRYSTECNSREYACTLDVIIVYALPDGTKEEKRIHTH